jgi:hypothetical protein
VEILVMSMGISGLGKGGGKRRTLLYSPPVAKREMRSWSGSDICIRAGGIQTSNSLP